VIKKCLLVTLDLAAVHSLLLTKESPIENVQPPEEPRSRAVTPNRRNGVTASNTLRVIVYFIGEGIKYNRK